MKEKETLNNHETLILALLWSKLYTQFNEARTQWVIPISACSEVVGFAITTHEIYDPTWKNYPNPKVKKELEKAMKPYLDLINNDYIKCFIFQYDDLYKDLYQLERQIKSTNEENYNSLEQWKQTTTKKITNNEILTRKWIVKKPRSK